MKYYNFKIIFSNVSNVRLIIYCDICLVLYIIQWFSGGETGVGSPSGFDKQYFRKSKAFRDPG